MKPLEYVDVKRAIEQVETAIEESDKATQINKLALKALKEELTKHKEPVIKDGK